MRVPVYQVYYYSSVTKGVLDGKTK